MKLQYEKHFIVITLLYLLYKVFLDLIYVFWVNPIFGYSQFTLDPSTSKVFISYIIVLFCAIIIPKTAARVSYMILQLHFIIMIIPVTSVYAYANQSTSFMLMIFLCFVIQILFIRFTPLISRVRIKHAKSIVTSIIVSLTVLTYFYMLKTQSVHVSAFDFFNIYKIRAEQEINSVVMGYLITWQYRIINPFLIVIAYLLKNRKLFFSVIGLQVLLYLMFPHKEVVLSIGLIMGILLISRFKYKFDSFFTIFLSMSSLLFIIVYEWFEWIMPFAVLPVRLLYVPALIKFQHFEFFSENTKLYYSEGTIGKLLGLEYPYEVSSGLLIGGGNNNANTGYLAYAYDNAGFLGMLLITFLFIALLILIDSLVRHENQYAIFAVLVYPMIILNDGDLITSMLTGGLFLLVIILFVFSNIGKNARGLINEK